MSLSIPTTTPPKGFHVSRSGDGWPVIIYQMTDQRGLAFFLTVWLACWTYGCVYFTWAALFKEESIDVGRLLPLIPFWLAEFAILWYTARIFWLVTVFTFTLDRLVVEHKFWGYARGRDYPKQAIHAVCQIQDSIEDADTAATWGLVIEGGVTGVLLSRQPIDKSDWLGPIVALWAGVEFEPSVSR